MKFKKLLMMGLCFTLAAVAPASIATQVETTYAAVPGVDRFLPDPTCQSTTAPDGQVKTSEYGYWKQHMKLECHACGMDLYDMNEDEIYEHVKAHALIGEASGWATVPTYNWIPIYHLNDYWDSVNQKWLYDPEEYPDTPERSGVELPDRPKKHETTIIENDSSVIAYGASKRTGEQQWYRLLWMEGKEVTVKTVSGKNVEYSMEDATRPGANKSWDLRFIMPDEDVIIEVIESSKTEEPTTPETKPEVKPDAPTVPETKPDTKPEDTGNIGAPNQEEPAVVVPIVPEETTKPEETKPEVKPEETTKPEETVEPEVKPEENTKPEEVTKPEVKPEETKPEGATTPDVAPDKEATPTVPEAKPEETKPEEVTKPEETAKPDETTKPEVKPDETVKPETSDKADTSDKQDVTDKAEAADKKEESGKADTSDKKEEKKAVSDKKEDAKVQKAEKSAKSAPETGDPVAVGAYATMGLSGLVAAFLSRKRK